MVWLVVLVTSRKFRKPIQIIAAIPYVCVCVCWVQTSLCRRLVAEFDRPSSSKGTKKTSRATKSDKVLVTKSVFEDGHVNIYGNKELKASQAYPKQFGKFMALVYKKNEKNLIASASLSTQLSRC